MSQKFHDTKTQKHNETEGFLIFTLHPKFETWNKLKFKSLIYCMKIEHVVLQKNENKNITVRK